MHNIDNICNFQLINKYIVFYLLLSYFHFKLFSQMFDNIVLYDLQTYNYSNTF